jgi:hypothetical protein
MLKFKIHKTDNFDYYQTQKLISSIEMLEKVINTNEFYKRFMELKLTSTHGMSNQEIYDLMMSGAEVLEPIEDNEADLFLTMYYSNNSTVGYTYSNTKEKWVNKKFFDNYDASGIAKNLIHEWMHKLGFGHKSSKELTSVPYATGFLIEEMVKELLYIVADFNTEWKMQRVKVCSRSWRSFWMKKICRYEDRFIYSP